MSKPVKTKKQQIDAKIDEILETGILPQNLEAVFGSDFEVPEGIKAELEEQGLEWRFLSLKKLDRNRGRPDKLWEIYKVKSQAICDEYDLDKHDKHYYIKNTVLAARPKRVGDVHRAILRKAATELQDRISRNQVDKMNSASDRISGSSVKVEISKEDISS